MLGLVHTSGGSMLGLFSLSSVSMFGLVHIVAELTTKCCDKISQGGS